MTALSIGAVLAGASLLVPIQVPSTKVDPTKAMVDAFTAAYTSMDDARKNLRCFNLLKMALLSIAGFVTSIGVAATGLFVLFVFLNTKPAP
jgi:hypothetical protein